MHLVQCKSIASRYAQEAEGAQKDPDFNGPIGNRSCTDIIFLLFFIAFIGGMVSPLEIEPSLRHQSFVALLSCTVQ